MSDAAQLLVERLQGLFEHAAVWRGGRAAEILGGASAGELERAAFVPPQQFGFTEGAHSGSRAQCFLLLSFDRLGFPTPRHNLRISQGPGLGGSRLAGRAEYILLNSQQEARATVSAVPTTRKDVVRIAAIGDLHYSRSATPGTLQPLFAQITDAADVLVIAGDLTDFGLPDEARALARELAALKIPAVAVLGNHDCESNQQDEVKKILLDAGVVTLDGDTTEVHGIGFAGVKGFAGGFGRGALGPWGEDIIKRFVHECLEEALKLETALARLRTEHVIAVLHYAPIQETVEGEPREIFPFLGCSRLEEPLTRFPVTAVFHGHAHHGQPEGRTRNNVPVFNVSVTLMRELWPNRPFRIVDVNLTGGTDTAQRRSVSDQRTLENSLQGS